MTPVDFSPLITLVLEARHGDVLIDHDQVNAMSTGRGNLASGNRYRLLRRTPSHDFLAHPHLR